MARTFESFKQPYITKRLGNVTATNNLASINMSELLDCAGDYWAKVGKTILPTSKTTISRVIPEQIAKGSLVVATSYHNHVVGGLIATERKDDYYDVPFLCVNGFNTCLKGYLSASAVWVTHRVAIAYAKTAGLNYIMTSCFYNDDKHIMNKILELDGWTKFAYMSIYKIGEEKCQ